MCIVAVVALTMFTPFAAAADDVKGDASDDHLWLVLESATGRAELGHYTTAMGDLAIRRHVVLSEAPDHLVAWGDRVLLINAPRDDGDGRRPAYSAEIRYDSSMDLYYTEPRDHLRIEPSLPGGSRLAGLVATSDGPVALLVPTRHGQTPTPPDSTTRETTGIDHPQLLRLERGNWVPMPLPDDLELGRFIRLAAVGADRDELIIISSRPERPARASILSRASDGTWSAEASDLDARLIRAVISVRGRPVAVVEHPVRDELAVAWLQDGDLSEIATLARPSRRFGVLGLDTTVRVISQAAGGDLRCWSLDVLTGETSGPDDIGVLAPGSIMVTLVSALFGLVIATAIVLLFLRPIPVVIELPADLAVVPVVWRTLALLIDLTPGALVALLVLDCSITDLLMVAALTNDTSWMIPYFTMAGITVIVGGVSDLIIGRSPGKAIIGARMIDVDGGRPTIRWILIRLAVGVVAFALPVLAVVQLLNPYGQGIHDQIARIVVVWSSEDQAPDGTSSSDGQ